MNNCIRFDLSRNLGSGHLFRALNLRSHLDNETFFLIRRDPALKKFSHLLPRDHCIFFRSNEFAAMDKLAKKHAVSHIILDIKNTTAAYIKKVRTRIPFIVSFDDLGTGRNHVDLLIDANRPEAEAEADNRLFGPDYIILHTAFQHNQARKKKINTSLRQAFIFFGGTDPGGLTAKIVSFLQDTGLDLTVLSPSFTPPTGIRHIPFAAPDRIRELLLATDIAIVSGGIIMFESLCCGTPTLVISQNREQCINARTINNPACLVHAGLGAALTKTGLLENLEAMRPLKIRTTLSRAGQRRVDGHGLKRIIEVINKMFY